MLRAALALLALVLLAPSAARGVTYSEPFDSVQAAPWTTTGWYAAVDSPVLATPTVTAGSGLAAGTYYYVVAAKLGPNANDPLTPRSNRQIVTLASASSVGLSWAPVPGATTYLVYRATNAAFSGAKKYDVGLVTSWSDTGGAPTFDGISPPRSLGVHDGVLNVYNPMTADYRAIDGVRQASIKVKTPPGVAFNGAALEIPAVPTPAITSAAGGSLASGATYTYSVAFGSIGGMFHSGPVTATVGAGSGSLSLSWSAIPGATGYRIYRGTSVNSRDRFWDVSAGTTTFTDSGQAATVFGTRDPWFAGHTAQQFYSQNPYYNAKSAGLGFPVSNQQGLWAAVGSISVVTLPSDGQIMVWQLGSADYGWTNDAGGDDTPYYDLFAIFPADIHFNEWHNITVTFGPLGPKQIQGYPSEWCNVYVDDVYVGRLLIQKRSRAVSVNGEAYEAGTRRGVATTVANYSDGFDGGLPSPLASEQPPFAPVDADHPPIPMPSFTGDRTAIPYDGVTVDAQFDALWATTEQTYADGTPDPLFVVSATTSDTISGVRQEGRVLSASSATVTVGAVSYPTSTTFSIPVTGTGIVTISDALGSRTVAVGAAGAAAKDRNGNSYTPKDRAGNVHIARERN